MTASSNRERKTGSPTGWNDRMESNETPKSKRPEKLHTWPYLVRIEFLMALFAITVLILWSVFIDAPLEESANPSVTPNPSKAPWYFLGLQELLVYFDPWIAGVAVPALIIFGLMAIPYIDINPDGSGYYTWTERKFAIFMFCFRYFGLWMLPILIGTFLRGPGWNLFMPWEPWDPHKVVSQNLVDLAQLLTSLPSAVEAPEANALFGLVIVGGYYSLAPVAWIVFKVIRKNDFLRRLGLIRYAITAFLSLTMMGVALKVFLRLAFGVKYFWVVKLSHLIPGLEFNI